MLKWFQYLLPVATVGIPIVFWLRYRQAASHLGPESDALPSIRSAAVFLATLMLITGIFVTTVNYLSGVPVLTCLMAVPPTKPWGYALWAGQVLFSLAFLTWLWVGPGARQLAAYVGAPPRGWTILPSRLRLLVTAALVLVPVVVAVLERGREVRPYCVAA